MCASLRHRGGSAGKAIHACSKPMLILGDQDPGKVLPRQIRRTNVLPFPVKISSRASILISFAGVLTSQVNAQTPRLRGAKRVASVTNPDHHLSVGLAAGSAPTLCMTRCPGRTNYFAREGRDSVRPRCTGNVVFQIHFACLQSASRPSKLDGR